MRREVETKAERWERGHIRRMSAIGWMIVAICGGLVGHTSARMIWHSEPRPALHVTHDATIAKHVTAIGPLSGAGTVASPLTLCSSSLTSTFGATRTPVGSSH